MQVTVIGAGNMGRGMGHRLVAGGHDVTVVDRDPEQARRLVQELRDPARRRAARASKRPNLARSCAARW
jgi:8-hydroxy-5-deazaflavin:NADPH oxidoreductase